MKITAKEFSVRGLNFIIRSAEEYDAKNLSEVRVQIDGETENMDREQGEGYIDEAGFRSIIQEDSKASNHLFLVAEVEGRIAGFSRCEGSSLRRLSHKVEFGVCVLKAFWGYGIGKRLLQKSIEWAELQDIKKISLAVLEKNDNAIALYENLGFETEGVLKYDRRLSDGNYYNTILMGKLLNQL
ncbi:GNAT family N-acetyltransferase [Fictibacillus fluitans]|uniref:GNAT family N-acetyltransferase n=1 Tax=Fictibacillus fluitans TaxID=3058422 RepID=A0ABT8HYR9_9BACL|nr:GNAT family N-acetyltransferase [Fictibacillus sp. NE201]MDN4525925.1 GNAT family N-acetyltransferase [Fictibacillus sp. NE201]